MVVIQPTTSTRYGSEISSSFVILYNDFVTYSNIVGIFARETRVLRVVYMLNDFVIRWQLLLFHLLRYFFLRVPWVSELDRRGLVRDRRLWGSIPFNKSFPHQS